MRRREFLTGGAGAAAGALVAAPWVALFGANGLVACNMAMLVAMIWMGTAYLRRFNGDATAGIFAVGFFVLSSTFAYAFWLQPELFWLAVTALLLALLAEVYQYTLVRQFWLHSVMQEDAA